MTPRGSSVGTAGRQRSRRGVLVGLGLLVVGSLLVRFDRGARVTTAVGWAVAPLHAAVTRGGQSVRAFFLDYVALTGVREENRQLQDEVRTLRGEAARTADLAQENARLRHLLDLGDRRKDLRLRAARVVARSSSEVFRVLRLTIDVGDGPVEQGMAVVAPEGVVGQIRSLAGSRAEVLLITDPRSAVDVVLEQSRARAIAVGSGENDRYAAHLRYLPQSVSPIRGERVLTTGDDGRYPRGLVVGEVVEVGEPESGPFKKTTIRPLMDPGTLEEVFVVLGPSGLNADGSRYETEERKKK
ncbi:MAG: rod shape-determining protein MreC [Myxococcales bacterium]|nr:rod shape-determining protein MreC [Myxococcales bacterium]